MIIYKITNKINGKCYVGQTIRPVTIRFYQHKLKSRNYPKSIIAKAIKKYGEVNFFVEILEECDIIEKLNEQEIYWIKTLNTKVPNGYNLTDGGGGKLGIRLSKKTKEKIGKKNLGRIPYNKGKTNVELFGKEKAEELRIQNSSFHKKNCFGKNNSNYGNGDKIRGEKNPNYGKTMSYESKEKSRNKQLGITWEIRYGKKEADKKKKKLSKKNKGRRPWIKGKHHTKESKEKMSNSHRGRSYEEKVGVEKAKKWIENKVLSYLKTINKKKNEKSNNN